MVHIAGVATAFPPHRYAQADITAAFTDVVLPDLPDPGVRQTEREVLARLHAATGVTTRSLALPLAAYSELSGFGEANDVYLRAGTELGEEAVRGALKQAGLEPADIDVLMTVSITGIGAPSIDARLVPRLGLRPDIKRVPVFGLGCVAGAAGLARVHDLLGGDPDGIGVLLSVELCSLTMQRDDASMANLVASGLFGDGAAAVVLVGERRAQTMGLAGLPAITASRSRFYPDTERVMGWDIGGSGFRIVLAATVADVVKQHLGEDVREFLADHCLAAPDIAAWIAHPGGPKVLHAVRAALGLDDAALRHTWESLADYGNLSSASVLHVLERTLAGPAPEPGDYGVVLALGPGFCAELVLLQW